MLKIIKILLLFTLILAILLNLNWFKSPIIGVILSLLYFIIFGFLLGKIIFSAMGGSASGGKDKEFSWQIMVGIFSLLSVYSLLGVITYYFYQLNPLSVSILFAVISLAILILDFKTTQNSAFADRSQLRLTKVRIQNLIIDLKSAISNPQSVILTITYLILFTIAIYTLFISQTSEAIRSPWQIIPKAFFIIYFLATLNLILLFFTKKNPLSLLLISLHFFLTTSVALIVYKLGYGFDPFVHQATEVAIFKNGFILPKPFYYLGQYSIVVILAHLFQITTDWVDKLLLPISLAIFLPYIIYKSLAKTFDWQKNRTQILCFTFLLLPFGLFIATTPQALANIFSLIILFLSSIYLKDKQISFWYLILLNLVAIAIHALAGLPILIYLIIIWLLQNKNKVTKIILPIFLGLATLALPLALLLNSFLSIYKIKIAWPTIPLIQLPNIFAKQYWYFLDLAYLYKYTIYPLIIIITLLTLYYLVKNHKIRLFFPSILTFIILNINSVFLSFINVSFIINYEQGEFASRAGQLSFYFLLSIVIYGLYIFISKAEEKKSIYQFFIIFLLSIFLTCSLYLSYPRFDDYDNSKFINMSQSDLEVVNFIEKNSHGQNYIVLTNQMTSAAALQTFGFSKYYNGQYFYPIPTGGQLYRFYEKMIYESTTKQTMEEAMEFIGVKTAYFVLPAYWSHFDELSAKANKNADGIYTVDDKIWVFKYIR